MTSKQWEDLEEKLVHTKVVGITPLDDYTLRIECIILETDDYFEFQTELEEN